MTTPNNSLVVNASRVQALSNALAVALYQATSNGSPSAVATSQGGGVGHDHVRGKVLCQHQSVYSVLYAKFQGVYLLICGKFLPEEDFLR